MLKYRGSNLIRPGIIAFVLLALVVAVGLQPEKLINWATTVRYTALFAEAGGLATGNKVTLAGIKVGNVSEIALQGDHVQVRLSVEGRYRLGSDTTAHIRTGSLLGERVVTLDSAGAGALRPLDVIPLSRTSSPYSLTEAVSDLTTNTAGTDTATLNQSLDTLSSTIDQIAPQLGPTFDGLTRLSRSLNSRNQMLGDVLKNTANVSKILSDRSQQVNVLILNANDLLGSARRPAEPDRLVAGQHLCGRQTTLRTGRRQREGAGSHPAAPQRGHRDAGEEPGQHLPGAAGSGEVPDHPGRDGVERLLLQRVRPQLEPWADPCSRSWTTPSGSGAGRMPGSHRTMPGLELKFPSPTTAFPEAPGDPKTISDQLPTILLAVLALAGVAVVVRQTIFGPKTISAYFTTTTAVYPGDDVRVLGVKVGTIDSIAARRNSVAS